MSKCYTCNLKASRDSDTVISCGSCNFLFHRTCVSLNDIDIAYLIKTKTKWNCPECEKKKKLNRIDDTCAASPSTLARQSNVMDLMYEELKQLRKESAENYKALNNKFEIIVKNLTEENAKLKCQVKVMQQKIDTMEQLEYQNSIDVVGVPFVPNENTDEVVMRILNDGLGLRIQATDISFSYRGKSKNPAACGKIFVKFCRRNTKSEVLQSKLKKNLKGTACGFQTSKPIFINESLSFKMRELYYQAKIVQLEKQYKHLWVRNSKIFMRKIDGSERLEIKDKEDLLNL